MSINYDDIKEGEKKQISKTIRDIDGVKYSEYVYVTKLKGGKIHKQIVKTKYAGRKNNDNNNNNNNNETNNSKKNETDENEMRQEKIKNFVKEYRKQMLISLQNLLKTQFNENRTIEEIIILYDV